MIDLVLDANVLLKWLRPRELPHLPGAATLFTAHEAGRIRVTAPPTLPLEVLNVAGRKWRVEPAAVEQTAVWLDRLRITLVGPDLPAVARWVGRGLSAYDAAYVAVAEATGVGLVTADRRIVEVAPGIARDLADADALPGLSG